MPRTKFIHLKKFIVKNSVTLRNEKERLCITSLKAIELIEFRF